MEPISLSVLDGLMDAFEENKEQALEAMPWLDRKKEPRNQMLSFLLETTPLSDIGDIHHWSIQHTKSSGVIGLIGADHMTNTDDGDFNLGYWVRTSYQRKGIAKRCIDTVLCWLATIDSEAVIEVTVNSGNTAGLATCNSLLRRWRGDVGVDNILRLIVHGLEVPHHNFLLPLSCIVSKGCDKH